MPRLTLTILALAALLLLSDNLRAEVIDFADAATVRHCPVFGTAVLPSGSLLVKKGAFEDQTILEFDVDDIPADAPAISLDLQIRNIDPGTGILDLFTFFGNSVVTELDFDAGGPDAHASFLATGAINIVSFDVTDVVLEAIEIGNILPGPNSIGFRLSTEGNGRDLLPGT